MSNPLGADVVAQWPELAVLEVLAATVAATRTALIAATGELASDDFVNELAGAPMVQACLADALLNHFDGLESALDRYRQFIAASQRRSSTGSSDF